MHGLLKKPILLNPANFNDKYVITRVLLDQWKHLAVSLCNFVKQTMQFSGGSIKLCFLTSRKNAMIHKWSLTYFWANRGCLIAAQRSKLRSANDKVLADTGVFCNKGPIWHKVDFKKLGLQSTNKMQSIILVWRQLEIDKLIKYDTRMSVVNTF